MSRSAQKLCGAGPTCSGANRAVSEVPLSRGLPRNFAQSISADSRRLVAPMLPSV